jgi:hypothetical protein
MERRFAVVVHYDAYLQNAGAFSHAILAAGGEVDFFSLDSRAMTLSQSQVDVARTHWPDLPEVVRAHLPLEDVVDPAFLQGYDGVFLGAGGPELLAGLDAMSQIFPKMGGSRPLVITGFPGILDASRLAGMLFRSPSDIILLPAPKQLSYYKRDLSVLGRHVSNGLLYGIPSLPSYTVDRTRRRPERILFIDQSVIPASVSERRNLIMDLVQLLEHDSRREIWIKERVQSGDTSVHESEDDRMRLSYQVERMRSGIPALDRIAFKGEPLNRLFGHCDAAISVSSTGLLEAMRAGLPVASLAPYCRNPTYGNGFFRRSGLQVDVRHLMCYGWPEPQKAWLADNVLAPWDVDERDGLSGQDRLIRRIQTLLACPRGKLINPARHSKLSRKIARMKPHVFLQKVFRL